MGPVHLKDTSQSHELAFMSKYNLSITEYNQFNDYLQSQPIISALQEQYYNALLKIICKLKFDINTVSPITAEAHELIAYTPPIIPECFHHNYALEKQLGQRLFTDDQVSLESLANDFSTYPRPILAVNNPLRSEQNLYITTVSTYARFAIEAGLSSETAFSYCDYFIQQVEDCTSISQVNDLLMNMVRTYKTLVRENNRSIYSSPVGLAKDFIDQHITETISLVEVADTIGYSAKYLSEIFVKETDITFKSYINDKKMEIAKSLLLNPKNSILDVCHYLGYCNQSYFSKIFKKNTGTSPSAFIKHHR